MSERSAIAHTDSEIREQIHDTGYANLYFDLGKAATNELFTNFTRFIDLCNEPGGDKLVEAVTFKSNSRGDGIYQLTQRKPGVINPNDYQRKAGIDHKYIMQFGPTTFQNALNHLGGELPEEMQTFLSNCAQFYIEGRDAGRLCSKALGIDAELFPEYTNSDVHVLRLIDYIASDQESLGEAHFDRGVATLAISESSPGLRGLPADNGYLMKLDEETRERLRQGLQPIEHHENIAKFFPGAGLRRLPKALRDREDLDQLPLLAHDIVNENPGENRQAVVMFFNPRQDFPGYTVPTSEETSVTY